MHKDMISIGLMHTFKFVFCSPFSMYILLSGCGFYSLSYTITCCDHYVESKVGNLIKRGRNAWLSILTLFAVSYLFHGNTMSLLSKVQPQDEGQTIFSILYTECSSNLSYTANTYTQPMSVSMLL